MDSLFLFKLSLSFLIGALWVISATVLADKLGSKIGGLISGLPSTVMFGLFFLGWTQNTTFAVQSTTIMPIVSGLSCLYLVCYVYLVRKNLWLAVLTALIIWSLGAYGLIYLRFSNYSLSIIGYVVIFLVSFLLIEKVLKIRSLPGKKITYTPLLILTRGLIGGFVVALAVFLGKVSGPILGGMFSMFPAMFTSTIFVTYYTHGADFSAATMKSSMITAISVTIYSIVARYTYIPLGLMFGSLASILVSFGSGLLIYRFVLPRLE